jgi:heme/copper-type cytochrome/quinol oxidase subunit 2
MYIIFGSVIVMVIILFGGSIFSMVKTYTTNPNPSFKIGNMWFITLLAINIILIIFIYKFYELKTQEVGKDGAIGDKGNTGKSGKDCIITVANTNNYAGYNGM